MPCIKMPSCDFGNIMSYYYSVTLQLFDWMQHYGKTNIASYSSYMKFMGRRLNPLTVLEIYNSIKDKSIRNSVSICNSVLNCLVKSGKFDSSLKLFNQMKQDGLMPDIVTYSTVCKLLFSNILIFMEFTDLSIVCLCNPNY